MFKKIKELWVWLTSKKVVQAINDGATYEEVCAIVKNETCRKDNSND